MAVVRLKRGSDTVDLYGDTDGFKMRHGGWFPGIAAQNMDGSWATVEEVINLRADGSSTRNLAKKLNALDTILRRSNEYTNRSFSTVDPVWLQAQLDGEGIVRQSLVFAGRTQAAANFLSPPATNAYTLPDHSLGLTRHPFWERDPASTIGKLYFFLRKSSVGGTAELGDIEGDVPARIDRAYYTATGSNALADIWMGFRTTEYYSDKDFYEPNWNCGLGTMGDGTSVVSGVSDAENSKVARWTPGDTDMLPRTTVTLKDVTSRYSEFYGRFLVLLRARVTSGGDRTFHVRLLSGYYDESTDSKWHTGKRVLVPNSDRSVAAGNFFYYPMGVVSIPADRTATLLSLVKNSALRLEAQVASGSSGNLDMNVLTLIPVNEGAIFINNGVVKAGYQAYVDTSPDDEIVAYNISTASDSFKSLPFTSYNWSIPTGTTMAVVAAQRNAQQVLADTIGFYCSFVERWLTLSSAVG
jgi:hypothetical protein